MSKLIYGYNGFGISAEPFRLADFNILMQILKETFPEGNFEDITKLSEFDYIVELSELNIEENINSETEGFKGVIANLIATKENIVFTTTVNEKYPYGAILFEPRYPWVKQSEEEQELTEDKLVEIFQKWQDILKIPKSKQRKAHCIFVGKYC